MSYPFLHCIKRRGTFCPAARFLIKFDQHFLFRENGQHLCWLIERLCRTNPARDSCRGSSLVAGGHAQTDTPDLKTRNWRAFTEARERRGARTIWFDPAMVWDAASTGKGGRQQSYNDTAIRVCPTMKVLFGMALGQTTGFVRSLLRSIGLDWACPTSAPCRAAGRRWP